MVDGWVLGFPGRWLIRDGPGICLGTSAEIQRTLEARLLLI